MSNPTTKFPLALLALAMMTGNSLGRAAHVLVGNETIAGQDETISQALVGQKQIGRT